MIQQIKYDDIDDHGNCDCGLCNSNGRSYGAALLDENGEIVDRIYGSSEQVAITNAHKVARKMNDGSYWKKDMKDSNHAMHTLREWCSTMVTRWINLCKRLDKSKTEREPEGQIVI